MSTQLFIKQEIIANEDNLNYVDLVSDNSFNHETQKSTNKQNNIKKQKSKNNNVKLKPSNHNIKN